MSDQHRLKMLMAKAAELLVLKGTLLEALEQQEERLRAVRDEIAGMRVPAGKEFQVQNGVVRVEQGKVTGRRSVNTVWLDEHFEDLPPEVRALCDLRESLVIDVAAVDFDDVEVLDGIAARAGGERRSARVWPKVGDLEALLPAELVASAITAQERGPIRLVFEEKGVSVSS